MSRKTHSYPEAVLKIAEEYSISPETCALFYMKFLRVSNKEPIIPMESFSSLFSFTTETPINNLAKYGNDYGVSFNRFVNFCLASQNIYQNTKFLDIFYHIFLTEQGFDYNCFITELHFNLMICNQEEENEIRNFFENGVAKPNGFLTLDQFKRIVTLQSNVVEKAKMLIFGSSVFL